MPDVVVVGGGAIGCALAYFLSRVGASVTLLERGELGGEASGAAAGMLAALSDEGGDRGPDFQKLCLDSFELYQRILPDLEASGIDLRYRRSGVLHLALDDEEASHLHRRFEAQRRLAPGMRWLEGGELRRAEPEVSPAAVAGLLSPEEHYLDPQRLVLALAECCRRLGVDIRIDAPVTSIRSSRTARPEPGEGPDPGEGPVFEPSPPEGRIVDLVRAAGEAFRADHLVLAAGPWTAALAKRLGAHVPVRPMRGQMLALGPALELNHVIWGEEAYLVPRENRLTFVGATVEDVGFRKRNTADAVRRLRRAAVRMIPSLELARVASTWAGLRPGSPDGLPMMGRLPGWSNVWVASGHFRNGILLAPITGKLMAAAILEGKHGDRLRPFDPARFGEGRVGQT
jgi:glycine oxidase